MPDIDSKIAEANSRLRSASIRVSIERRGNKLWLRATLPPKPHINKQQPYQQKVSLDVNTTPAGLQAAFIRAKAMGLELDSGKFSWSNWIEAPEEVEIISEWLQRFEDDHWQRTKQTDAALTTWKDYKSIFNKLERDHPLTLDAVLEVVKATEPDSRNRKKACTYLHKLGKFAALDGVEVIKGLAGNYSASAVQPRKLPTDKLVAEYRESIKSQSWQWLYGMIATYLVRSHEVFRLNLEDFPVVRVLRGKTGERFIYPLYPEWTERWNLQEMTLPNLDLEYSNAKLGVKFQAGFMIAKLPFGLTTCATATPEDALNLG